MKSVKEFILDLDKYGRPIGVHFMGADTYKTWLGSLCTIAVYAFVLFNLYLLSIAFDNGSKQTEKISVIKFDRHESDSYNLTDSGIKLYIFPSKEKEIGVDN